MNTYSARIIRFIKSIVSLTVILALQSAGKGQSPIDISVINHDKGYRINDVAIYANDKKLTIDTLLEINRSRFVVNPGSKAYKSVSSDRYNWFRFTLKNSSDDTVAFKFINGNNQINEMELFRFFGDTLVSLGKTGRLYPFYQRPYPFLHFTFPVTLNPKEEVTYIFFADCRGISYRVMLFLFNNKAFRKGEQRLYTTYGFFAGILLLSSLFNLFLFVINREKIHFVYSIYSLSVILSVYSLQSLDFQYLYPNYPHYTRTGITTYTSISCLLLLWVMQLFLRQTSSNSRFFRSVNYLKWFCALMPVFAFYVINFTSGILPVKIYLTLYPIMLASTFILAFACCVEKLIQGYKLAIFYLIAIGFVIVSGSLMALGIMERKYYLSLPPTLYDLSLVVEALIICFGILFRYILIKKERDNLEKALQEQQLASSKQLIMTQEAERKRIAEDLHDELGSSLAALKLRLQKTGLEQQTLHELIKVVDKASADTRNISHNLMPPEFEKTSLNNLLSNYYSKLNNESGIRFHFHSSGEDHHFSKEDELVIYRIIMELTGNILKHAGANEVTVQLIYYGHQLEIMAEDDGIGIQSKEYDGIGLKNVQSRVNYLSGEMTIDSGTVGTTIIIQVPYKSKSNASNNQLNNS